ncbi:MAG TPA: ATP-dependent sacrificial sulfur transferase LarE [Candidatus Edwardsbacteria bacterium]|nr:ATP-dependent sacrificial sulfur transferase LarE [Candidatus Edwardsbacteria bacterium]
MTLKDKERKVLSLLKGYGSAVIAYSGGTDSTLLALLAKRALGNDHLAVTASSQTYTTEELAQAKAIARKFGFNHMIVTTDELDDPQFTANPVDRCYHCKNHLLKTVHAVALQKGFKAVLDGTNADDGSDFRPGRRAAQEWGVKSPLAEAGLTKAEVRKISRRLGLPNWDKPANACLASRLPYGTPISADVLSRIEQAERALRAMGFKQCRVRHHGDIARIELLAADIPKAINKRAQIIKQIKSAGYKFVTLDLAGYQMGCFNP